MAYSTSRFGTALRLSRVMAVQLLGCTAISGGAHTRWLFGESNDLSAIEV